jgi:aminotransferase
MRERTVTIGGFGKTFAVTGWRIGYVCALDPLSRALRTVHDYVAICAPSPLQAACAAALEMPPAYYEKLKREYRERRDIMMSILREARFEAEPPEGAYYVMADFGRWNFEGDDVAFAHYLAMKHAVAVVPASCFYGTPGSGKRAVRFAFAKKLETLAAAGERLRRAH